MEMLLKEVLKLFNTKTAISDPIMMNSDPILVTVKYLYPAQMALFFSFSKDTRNCDDSVINSQNTINQNRSDTMTAIYIERMKSE